jgi:dTDP-4-amino-4,6-dideoxygalactose transaminase
MHFQQSLPSDRLQPLILLKSSKSFPSNVILSGNESSKSRASPPITIFLFNRLKDRTYVTGDIKTPDPIPVEGQQAALALMQSGRLYRYNIGKGEESTVSMCEKEICDYTGFKYCVGLNSCGSALMLLLKTTGLKPGGKVLSNAFTFGAVPSAIEHANGKAVYVESNRDHVINVADLETKLIANPDAKHVLISHMRGKVADMAKIKELCDKHDAILLEDCAHSLGVMWEGVHTGHMGIACAISSQSYKMINSGEGGFLLTDDPEIAAQTAVIAGAYEGLAVKHMTVPGPEHFEGKPVALPNYSIRMSNLAAAVIRPQIKTLDERIAKYGKRYNDIVAKLEARVGEHMYIPQLTPGVTRMVHDSVQFNLDAKFTPEMLEEFLVECSDHGLTVECFGHKSNARNFVNWGFAPADEPLPETAEMLKRACDCRMPLMWEDEEFDDMANVLMESVESVLAKHNLL